ncbi:MAG: hypothetical protein QG656_2663, partial [Candidatus Hydrogenedentes bacterium]|nr:hypothetical protein [Candidatus Hydrogenedentota bacterium]
MSRYRSPLSTFRIFPILCATFFAMAAMAAPVGFWPSGQGVDFPRTGPVADAPGFSFGGDTTEVVSTSEVCATDPATGLVMRQRRMWLPELGVARVETELINPGSAAVEAGDVLLVDWRFQVLDTQDGTRYRDLTYRNDVWYGSTYWTGPDWTRVGLDWHHPGENTPSVRRFTAPRDGRVSIAGRAFKADTNCGDGVRLTIRLRAEMVWEAEIDAADTAGVEPALTLDVEAGDALRFIVHKRGEIACDTTRWDPVVTYDDGTRYQASQGFSAVLQAGGAWSYEMEVDPDATVRLPVIHGFARDASLYEVTPSVNTPVSIEDGLPLAVLSDADDASGIAILVDSAAAWRLDAALDADGGLRFAWSVGERTVGPGGTRMLPVMYQGRYEGTWTAGMAALERLRGKMPELRGLDGEALPELDYWAMIQADWRKQDGIDGTLEAYRVAIGLQRAKTRALLNDLRASYGPDWLSGAERELDILDARQSVDEAGLRALYLDVRTLKRRIAL